MYQQMEWKKTIIVKFGEWLIKYLDLLEEYLQQYSEEFIEKSKIDFDDPECDVIHSVISNYA